jgi:hypothetical protein
LLVLFLLLQLRLNLLAAAVVVFKLLDAFIILQLQLASNFNTYPLHFIIPLLSFAHFTPIPHLLLLPLHPLQTLIH